MEYFIGLLFLILASIGVWLYKNDFTKLRFWLSLIFFMTGFYGYAIYQSNLVTKKYSQITNNIINRYEKEIEILNHKHKYQSISSDTIEWSVIIDDWKFTKDSIEYIGDTVFVVNLDSIQSLYKYYRIALEPPSYAIKLMTVCYGDYDNWKKRTVNGVTQYSLDGTNWFEL